MRGWTFDIRSRAFVLLWAAFLAVTGLVISGATSGLDAAAASWAGGLSGSGIGTAMLYVTEGGDVFAMMVLGIVVLAVRRTRRMGAALMILLVLTTLVTGYVKCGVDRDRPEGGPDSDLPVPVSRDTFALFCPSGLDSSYPSGHAARTMAFAVVFGYAVSHWFPRGSYLVLLYPALVSASRVLILEHYPMDVVGGAVVGLVLAGMVARKTGISRILPGGS
ncbi:MAG: phosphatase PAP2 family protein [Nitrosopumilus sp.]|nr:phosphatase PAP2 family protein [Nitrosopumilus sp.]CAI9832174.1 PA-phosphatase like phosphoesterase [Nitrosopumilaceae archaeon]MDA7945375.1 phosphatase PAP2 family protein [Nitrosopumilus sp.]MDA7952745.1 phosphatase PAP2 family protein [Nitrosopumilus sp.]MDA7954954.1 phosphatase PAP2 family protein [Nitrosopumilus sp.]